MLELNRPEAPSQPTLERTPARLPSALLGLLASLVAGVGLVATAQSQPASSPTVVLPYDGYLTQGEMPFNGTASIKFSLHSGETCTDCELWTETQTVRAHGGRFSVGLGVFAPLMEVVDAGSQLWLGMEVDGQPLEGRQSIEPSPMAYWAPQSDVLEVSVLQPLDGGTVTIDHGTVAVYGAVDVGVRGGANLRALALNAQQEVVLNPRGDYDGGVVIPSLQTFVNNNGGESKLNGIDVAELDVIGLTVRSLRFTTTKVQVSASTIGAPVTAPTAPSNVDCLGGPMTEVGFRKSSSGPLILEAICP